MFFNRIKNKYKLWIIMALTLTGMLLILTAFAMSLKPILNIPSFYWLHWV